MTTIQLRRGTAAQWSAANPVLAEGEKGIETDTHKEKTGDGATPWNNLQYAVGDLIPGTVLSARWGGSWPARPSSRNDVVVFWVGGTTRPSGMLPVDIWLPVSTGTSSGGGGSSDTTAPTVPANLTASGISANALTFTWSNSTDAVGVTGYEIRLNGGTAVVKTSQEISHTFTGLTTGTAYTATVRARDAAGNYSAWSSGVTATPSASSDVTAPTVPSSLTSSAISASGFTLSWAAATDAVGVTGYEVRVNNGTAVAKGAGVLTHTFTGLTASTVYAAQVRARDAAGNFSAWSTALNVTTSGSAPSATFSVMDADVMKTGATPGNFTDLGVGGAVASFFYSPAAWEVRGARLYVPAGADAWIGQTVTFRVHLIDYVGVGLSISGLMVPANVPAARTVQATIDGTDKWVSATLATPTSILPIAATAIGNNTDGDVAVISAQIGDGHFYPSWPGAARTALGTSRSITPPDSGAIPQSASASPKLYWAEGTMPHTAFFLNGNWGTPPSNASYGVDVLAGFV